LKYLENHNVHSAIKQKHFAKDASLTTYKSLGTDYTKEELLESFPGARTVPQIKINGTTIGGYDQFVQYLDETGYNGTGHTVGH
jgi:glutaredoxin